MEILIYNIIFWTVWIYLSTLPARAMQYVIDNNETFFKLNEKKG